MHKCSAMLDEKPRNKSGFLHQFYKSDSEGALCSIKKEQQEIKLCLLWAPTWIYQANM